MYFDPKNREDSKDLILKDSEKIKRYIHGGKGELLLAAPNGKAHRYAFLEPMNTHNFPEGTIFVYVLHNDRKYYLGMVPAGENVFKRTSGSSFGEDTEAVKGARFIVRMSNDQSLTDRTKMELYQSGNCCMCGRPLKSEFGLEECMGKKCLQRYNLLKDLPIWDGNSDDAY